MTDAKRIRFDCIHCGTAVKVDEEGCCFHCGRATVIVENGTPDYRGVAAGEKADEAESRDLRAALDVAEAKLAEIERARVLARHAEIAAKTARNEALREQERIADDLLADARRMLDELAGKYRVTLIGERAKNSWCYTCAEPVAPGCGPEHDVRPAPLAAGKEMPPK